MALIHATGNRAMRGVWLSLAARDALAATLLSATQAGEATRAGMATRT